MARYKGNYKDLFKDTATYTIDGKETKTVKGESNSNFQAGMDLTVKSGKLTIRADTLDETTTQWHEVDWTKSELGWRNTQTYLGGNINLFGAFFLSTVNTHSIAGVIVSNGKSKWANVNLVQLLIGVVAKQEVHERLDKAGMKKVLAGIAFNDVKRSFWKNKKTRIV